ncbi:MAG: tRNA (adenosine(37)-N6)-dimethylallyltransferase MiaA [Acidimicrobiaceae bacterium TMED77]|nr:tRNA (adenosine(37)-N6)-dimethylallyltransferase MiaA [Acidimicrobiales bacterium]OUU99982.1 MAG: tRNA (adenosine(37)-N6)-dimethylallyltransferase MiaA [Acidimicrobiaceae bacterium TMED77]
MTLNGTHPLLALVGTTASGKSYVAMELAKSVTGLEIISVDSMQIYRGMDVGTAKPSEEDLRLVPHHMIDLVDPHEEFTISEFQKEAKKVLNTLQQRKSTPLLVGGTGLHLRTIIDNLTIPSQYPQARSEIESEPDTEKLYTQLQDLDSLAASRIEKNNRRRIVRALEVTVGSEKKFSSYGPGLQQYPESEYKLYGLRWSREAIDRRILERYEWQLKNGFFDEVQRLSQSSKGISRTASQALGYKQFLEHLRGNLSFDEALEKAIIDTKKFARKQERWFRRDPRINWIEIKQDPLEAVPILMKEYR